MAPPLSRIEIVGAGPAGLYTAILARLRLPGVDVHIRERNPRGATFGFGVVFSDQALDFLKADAPELHELVVPKMEHWRNMTLNLPARSVTLDGVGFSAIGRLRLLTILETYALSLGVKIEYDAEISSLETLQGDLVVGADGVSSLVRESDPEGFAPTLDHFTNRFAWFGTPRGFDMLTQTFIETDLGPLNAHHYRFAPEMSTFIVECGPDTWRAQGLDQMDERASAAHCAALFADVLDGAELVTNRSAWRTFPRLRCERWVSGNRVIIGDAAHSSHFSIGSGTRLAMEDAIALVASLGEHETLDGALGAFQDTRPPLAGKIVDAANRSASWYDDFGLKMRLPPLEFARDYLMRSGRMNDDRLRKIAPGFMAEYDAASATIGTGELVLDPVADDAPGAIDIDFDRRRHSNCSQILWRNLAVNPDKLALVGPAGCATYAELIAEAARWGRAFIAAGLRRGERIPFFLDDTPAYAAAFFGAVRAGFVPVLLNTQTNADTLAYFLTDTEARIVLCEGALGDVFPDSVLAGSAVETVIIVNGEAGAPSHQAATAFLAGHEGVLACADTGPNDMAFWMYSSGTTGRPKGIVHLHHDMAYTQASYGEGVLGITAGDICFSVPKIFFAYGFGNSLTFPFSVGATSVLLPGRPDPGAIFDAIETYRPTLFFGLPTLYTALTNCEGAGGRDLTSIRRSISAAETLSAEIYNGWKSLAGHGPTEGLGSTELLHIYLSNTHDDHRIGAAGAPVPGYEVRLVDPDGNAALPGADGVMLVRGHSSAPCYWRRPDKTTETMHGDWIYTGDRFVERDGYFYFQGRADDLVKVSGQWVWPLEIERCLNEHEDVRECAVMAHRLADGRTTLRAVVVLMPGRDAGEARTKVLQDHVRGALMPFKYPRLVEYRDDLPKTGTGKIDRQALVVD